MGVGALIPFNENIVSNLRPCDLVCHVVAMSGS